MAQENIISTATDADFDALLKQETRDVLAWFSAAWCGPCKRMAPVLRVLAAEQMAQVKIVNIDVEQAPQLSEKFQIRSLPSFLLFRKEKLLGRRSAVMTSTQLKEFIEHPTQSL